MILIYVVKYIKMEGDYMTQIREEVLSYINDIPDNKLEAIKPILALLLEETIIIETNLTDEEKSIINNGREEYKKGEFISLDSL